MGEYATLIRSERTLPYSFVHYPAHCEGYGKFRKVRATAGPFIGFSEAENSDIYFCSCFKKTIENHLQLWKMRQERGQIAYYSSKYRNIAFSSNLFPFEIAKVIVDNSIPDDEAVQLIKYRDRLCHKCNQATPIETLNYSGFNTFASHYGWYISKKQIDLGYADCHCVLDICPDDIKDILAKIAKWNNLYNQEAAKGFGERSIQLMNEYNKRCNIEGRNLKTIVENYVRDDFKYKRIGEFWVTETLLFKIVKQVFCDSEVLFHYRPQILEGLELDIFIRSVNVGIEYQGVQHFEPIDFWGGRKALETTQRHDRRKKELCDNNGITLIYFYYTDEINEELVRDRLKAFIL